jgi:molecular chaperone DnaJ
MTHYERLGVVPDASGDAIRAAYRRAARANHPDTHGEASAQQMAEINTAWWVLRDGERRRAYDDSLRPQRAASSSAATTYPTGPRPVYSPGPAHNPLARYQDPPRFPWKLMAVMASVGIGVVLLGVIIYHPSAPMPPDNLLGQGSCVVVQSNDDAAEVNCTDPHDGVVQVLVSFGGTCPQGSEPHRDRQGMGVACIRR